jgi:hypothetical protein
MPHHLNLFSLRLFRHRMARVSGVAKQKEQDRPSVTLRMSTAVGMARTVDYSDQCASH